MACQCPPGTHQEIRRNQDETVQWRICSGCGYEFARVDVREVEDAVRGVEHAVQGWTPICQQGMVFAEETFADRTKYKFFFPVHAAVFIGAKFLYEGTGYVVTTIKTLDRLSDVAPVRVVQARRCPVISIDPESRLGDMATPAVNEVYRLCAGTGYQPTARQRFVRGHEVPGMEIEVTGGDAESRAAVLASFQRRQIMHAARMLNESTAELPAPVYVDGGALGEKQREPNNAAYRALNEEERLFMLRSVARIEAELRWLLDNHPTACLAWKEAKRAKLSDGSAAEMALICLARENEDLRSALLKKETAARRALVPVLDED